MRRGKCEGEKFIYFLFVPETLAMALAGKKLVESLIKSKAVFVISKSYCPFCHKVGFVNHAISSPIRHTQ